MQFYVDVVFSNFFRANRLYSGAHNINKQIIGAHITGHCENHVSLFQK